jgi:hypothetical protein
MSYVLCLNTPLSLQFCISFHLFGGDTHIITHKKYLSSTGRDTRNAVHEKRRGISRNYTTRNSAEFRRNFSQFRTEYGIDGSKKNRRNSVSTECRGHPSWGESQFRRGAYTVVLFICTYFVGSTVELKYR